MNFHAKHSGTCKLDYSVSYYLEALINEWVDIVSEDLGLKTRPNVKVYYNSNDFSCGDYNPDNNTLSINMRNRGHIDDFGELINTIAHECRHAYQVQVTTLNTGEAEDTISIWRNNLKPSEYIYPSSNNYKEYVSQPVEADAVKYASNFENAAIEWLFSLAA